jgi:hypothetical protein
MTLKRIMMVAAIIEIATGIALIVFPMPLIKLLLGVYAPWTSVSIGRVAGVAVYSLGVACRPLDGDPRPAAWSGMLMYQGLVAAYFAYLSLVGGIGGVLLWPVVGVHALFAVALLWTGRGTMWGGR